MLGRLRSGMEKSDLDEHALIEQAKYDREAFGKLYELYVDRIYNYVYYRTGDRHEAEDLTAWVFFRAIQHIDRYEDKGAPFSAWLYRIARNMLANWYRDNSKRSMISLESVSLQYLAEDPESAIERDQDREALLTAIRRLPSERQDLLILKHVERLSNIEIGQIIGRSEGAIKSLYHRTLVSLRAELTRATDGTDSWDKGRWLSLPPDQQEEQPEVGIGR